MIPGVARMIPGVARMIPGVAHMIPGAARTIPGVARMIPGAEHMTPGVVPMIQVVLLQVIRQLGVQIQRTFEDSRIGLTSILLARRFRKRWATI